MDQTDDVLFIKFLKRIFQRPSCAFSGITFPPEFSFERPSEFETRPAFGIKKADTSSELSRGFFFNSPKAIAAKLPVANYHGQVAPGFGAIECLAAEIAHHLRIGAQARVSFEVIFAPPAQDESFRFQSCFRHFPGRLFSFPAHSVFRIFENYAAAGEFTANLVGPSKVSTSTSFLALVDQILNFTVKHFLLLGSEDVQHGVEAFQ